MSTAIPEQFQVPSANQMTRNPMLPQHPVTAAYDSQYAADEAVLRAQISRSYADILQQLGYTDEQGNFITGSVATNAARQQTDLNRSSDLAAEQTTQDSQRSGTLFSGYRGTAQARAQYPFQQSILDLGINVPLQLSQLHEQAAGLTDQYTLQNNQLLAAAAQRQAAALTASGGGTPASTGGAPAAPVAPPSGGGAPGAPGESPVHDLPLPDIAGPSSVWPNLMHAVNQAADIQNQGNGMYPNILAAVQNAAAVEQKKRPLSGYAAGSGSAVH